MTDNGTSSHAADLLNQAGSTTRTRADQQVRSLGGTLSGVADQLGQMAEGSADPGSSVAGLARDGAKLARTVADRLDREGLDGALSEVTSFARRRPMLFLAGAFAAGIGLGRLTRNADLGGLAQVVKDAPLPSSSNGSDASDGPDTPAAGQTGAGELGAMGLRPEAAGEQHVPGPDEPLMAPPGGFAPARSEASS